MTLSSTLLTIGLKTAATGLLVWATLQAVQTRDSPSAKPLVALLAAVALWAAAALGDELVAVVPGNVGSTLTTSAQLVAGVLIPGVWVVYVRSYTGRRLSQRWMVVLFAFIALPLVVSGAVVATASSSTAIERQLAPLIGAELLALFSLFVYGTYVMVQFGGDHARVSNTQVAVVTGGVSAPYLFSIGIDSSEPTGGASVGLLTAGILLAVAVRRYPVATGFPKADYVARTRVVETLREAVVVLDWDDHVLDVNERTVELFGQPADEMIGSPLQVVADGLRNTDLSVGATGPVSLRTVKGRRQFQFSVSAVSHSTADADTPVARTVLLRDVTGQETRNQRLSVLNRILRHNIRNDLDAVLAYTNRIDANDVRTNIETIVDRTVRLSAKARETEEVMATVTNPPEPVDLAAVATSVAESFRSDEFAGDISVDATQLQVRSHRAVLRRVLYELVENALEHTDSDSPYVEIDVQPGPDWTAELIVADDGPGLPDREQEILAAGTETQLKHGRGIGLWFVRWAVTQLGGELEFHHNDPTGSIVTVRLDDIEK